MKDVIQEFRAAAVESPRLYFLPITTGVQFVVRLLRKLQSA